jgi:hypothetical protein
MGVNQLRYSQILEKKMAAGMPFDQAHTEALEESTTAAVQAVQQHLDTLKNNDAVRKATNPVPRDNTGKLDAPALAAKLKAGGLDPKAVDEMMAKILNPDQTKADNDPNAIG